MDDYWNKLTAGRVTRRRALAGTAAGALGAAFLAACGGSDSGSGGASGGGAAKEGLVSKPVDTLKSAKRGGISKDRNFGDVSTLDPFTPNNTLNAIAGNVYGTLVQFKPGYLKPSENELAGDLAESWETSPDGLTITLKLRQGVKWHNKAPVNGRLFDAEDVKAGWERFSTKFSSRAGILNSLDPSSPVVSLGTTDARTVVIKLKEPIFYALSLFTSNFSGNICFMPKEADNGFDPRNEMIGTGPFYLDKYTPSQGFVLKRHPDYWDKDYALIDQIDMPIVSEYSQALSQFKAGNIYTFGSYRSNPIINADDVLPTKRDLPKIGIYQGDITAAGLIGQKFSFGFGGTKSPFLDERVRQAVSMSWDRDLYLDTFFNIQRFAAEGMVVDKGWNTALSHEFLTGWIDPQSKEFGPNAKYFKKDIAEAKKLLAAAGHPNGFEVTSSYVTGPELGTTPKHAEVVDGFIRELGLKVNVKSLQYANEYIPRYRDGKGQYEGYTYVSTAGAPTGSEPLVILANEYWSKGSSAAYHGFSASGANDLKGDPQVDQLIEKGRLERDANKRKEIVHEIQRYLAKPWYAASMPGMGTAFTVAWPAVGNFRVYQQARSNYQWWIDDTKAPIAK